RRADRTDGAVRLEQTAARHLGRRDRVELAAGEAREAELGEDARPLAMGSGELARERRRPLGRARLAHRLAPAEALLGEPGVVGAGVALGHVREELARLRPAPEAREHARLPVFRGDACHPRAPPGEPREGLGGGRHLAREVADPRRAPACLGGGLGVRVALGEARVSRARFGPAPLLLRDASGGVERIRRRRAVREAPQHLAEEAQRPGVVVGVPAPAGGCGQGARRERLRGVLGDREAGRLGGRTQPERALGQRALAAGRAARAAASDARAPARSSPARWSWPAISHAGPSQMLSGWLPTSRRALSRAAPAWPAARAARAWK